MQVDHQFQRIQAFLLAEGLAFSLVALLHVGLPIDGYEQREAVIFESMLGGFLFLGYMVTRFNSSWTRRTGIASQGLAVLGTVIVRFSIIAGHGSWTIVDLFFYRVITAVLLWGLVVAIIAPTFTVLGSQGMSRSDY